jgi:hypothetical protein
MSVMLATVNPEAAKEAGQGDRRVPYIGQWVVFHSRPGEGRGGKMTAPAMVTHIHDEDHVELLIVHSADDLITRFKIPRKTEQNNINCWAFNEQDEKHYQRSPLIEILERLEALEDLETSPNRKRK